MSGLRERKRHKTFTAIHDAAMELFARHGYANVTVADIAEAAEVSRATVFAYYPAKEYIVIGEAPLALEQLGAALDGLDDRATVIAAVREWLRGLAGWLEPELVLQVRLAQEVPAVAGARSQLQRQIEDLIAAALARTMGDERLAAQLAAGSLAAALVAVEQEAAQRMATTGHALSAEEIDALLDDAVAFVDGGLARLGTPTG